MILVTGGTGFLGSHVLAKLAQENIPVRALKRETSSLYQTKRVFEYYNISHLFQQIEWINGDLLNYSSLLEATENVTHIFHAGAIVSFQKKDKKSVVSDNIKGTANLVNAALTNKVKRFCHVSSVAALGVTEDESLIDETTQWKSKKSNSAYSIGKYYSELHAWRGFAEGMTGIVVCPSIVIGQEDRFTGISPLIYMVKKGLKYYPIGSNGFVDVRDVADIIVKLTLHTEITNEKFIVNAENLSYRNLLSVISKVVIKPQPTKEASLFKLKMMYFIENILRTLKIKNSKMSLELIQLISRNYSYSNQKIRSAISFNFRSVEESVKDSMKS